MLLLTVWLTVCLASSTVMAVSYLDKPYYDLNDAENLFKDFAKEHGKEYESTEYFKRLEIFKQNLKDINRRNEMYPQTVFKVNYRADMKLEEAYKNHHIKDLYSNTSNETIKKVAIPDGPHAAPEAFDWRTLGKVTRVKDQGKDCGSSYIFSTIGNIESQFAIKHQQLLVLSEGQVLDCCYVNSGCFSGEPAFVMQELATRPGIMLEADYPYVPKRRYCHENNSNVAVGVVDGYWLDTVNEEKLKQMLYDIGPLSVCFDDTDFRFYHEGIVEPDECGLNLNACVLLVGYGKGNIEGQYAIKHGQCLALSEGQALDCLECGNCNSGDMGDVMRELNNRHLEKEGDYSYKPVKQSCHEDPKKGVVQVTGKVTYLDTMDEEVLKSYLVHIGPLSIALNADDMQTYKKGILEPHKCINQTSNHAVLLVGYGTENNKKYWIIKNSWGEHRGEKGYVRLLRGVNACGIGGYTVTTTVI